jgi:hypothetical protein
MQNYAGLNGVPVQAGTSRISKGKTMGDEEIPKEDVAPKEKPGLEIIRTILQEGVDFEVTAGKKSRKFIIYPINLGTLFNISKIILTMKELESSGNQDLFAAGIKNIVENKDKMLEVVSLAILNRRLTLWAQFLKWLLIRFLNKNLNAQELFRLVQLVILQMDVTDFLASFVSVRRLNLAEASGKANIQIIGESSVA